MAFIPVHNCVMAELRGSLFGEQVENTLYFQYLDPVTVAEMQGLANILANWWDVNMAPLISEEFSLQEVYCTDLTTDSSPTAVNTTGTPVGGDDSGDSLPGNVAFCVSFRTAARGRTARGRNYICGIPESQVTGNEFSNGIRLGIIAAYELLPGLAIPGSGTVSVVSRYENGVARLSGLTRPITSFVQTRNSVTTQRRRTNGT